MSTPESAAIPYEPNDLRGERLLVLAPHPDDEVIGCGGLVALHAREGRAIRIIVVTDGAEAGSASVREEESRKGTEIVGAPSPQFLRFRDRALGNDLAKLEVQLRGILEEFKPDLIAVPSPAEIHPDHIALSRAFCELVQGHPTLFADLAIARVAFFEVSAPIRPNTLVDITPVSHLKYQAVAAHASQRELRDYISYAEGLNAYRAMTLPPTVKFAEAYWVTPLPVLRTTPFSALRTAVTAPAPVEILSQQLPISVIVRTKNRPALLADAVRSIRQSGYPAEVVVVNDGGEAPTVSDATIINNKSSVGRSEAANIGARAAKSAFLTFLDDDDLFYPEHLPTLANAARTSSHVAWYTDAVSAFLRTGNDGGYETYSRMRIFGQDFDRDLLLIDNYIPLPTLLIPREHFLGAGGFDAEFDLFEDWDFLIRLSRRGTFTHIPRITCEIRHIEGGSSITLESPEGSEAFRAAKLRIWQKHADLIDNDVIANVFERQKRQLGVVQHGAVEVRGLADHLNTDVARLQRDQTRLAADIQSLQGRATYLEGANAELRGALQAAEGDRHEKTVRLADLQTAFNDVSAALHESQRTTGALRNEVGRLQTLLDMIYRSRTWKLHNMVEKMKGR